MFEEKQMSEENQSADGDGIADAVAATVVITVIIAAVVFWLSGLPA